MGSICVILFVLSVWKFPLISQLVFLTDLGNQLTAFTCFFTYYLASSKRTPVNQSQGTGKDFIALVALEYSLVIQVMVVSVYWLMIHNEIIDRILATNDAIIYWLNMFIHILPFLAALVNTTATSFTFVMKHYIYCLCIAAIYAPLNYIGTKIRGKPVYPFLKWEDMGISLLISAGFVLVAIVFFFVTAYLINLSKKGSRKKRV
jgi:hypothetical protein